ncbi:MAG: ABC transporter permease [Deltaproteobacteria bacterium]|nr:ABC transporter permease [Deltaproteobacteria bacterium]
MIKFLLTGLFMDKSRSRLPVIVVSIGVMLTVLMHAYITGIMGDTIEMNARFSKGHLKVMTQGYAENMQQIPNDLALTGVSSLLLELKQLFPDIDWSPRIQFGGLVDAPDENGETRSQGPAMGIGINLLAEGSPEAERLNLAGSLVRGTLPRNPGEALLSEAFALKLGVNPGDAVTLLGSTMYGSMTMYNFVVSGTVSTGQEALDRGLIIADIEDIRMALNMEDASGEIVGFFRDGFYDDESAVRIAERFNSSSEGTIDDYAPVIRSLSRQGSMGTYVEMSKTWSLYISMVFVFAMSLVLWNAGLLGGLRRYGEVGLRLAIGEEKGHIYRSMICESIMVGIAGSIVGTALGLLFAWLIQKYGIDISGMVKGSSMMMPTRIRARITPVDFWLGFIPGLISTVIGTMLSGIGIYKRQTASLFKELEV